MKEILLLILGVLIFNACSDINQQLMIADDIHMTRYNHKSSFKSKEEMELHRLVKIEKNRAEKIAQTECHEKTASLRLMHKGQLLFYRIFTPHCEIEINALDGKIIRKEIDQ